jgi:hypothetical protein
MNKHQEKYYSIDGAEGWTPILVSPLDWLMRHYGKDNPADLIGTKYFTANAYPVTVRELVSIESIIDTLRDNVVEVMGFDYAENWPGLTGEETAEFENLIVEFLEKKSPSSFFHIGNIEEKTITVEEAAE